MELQLASMKDCEVAPGVFLLEEPMPIPGSNRLRALANVYGTLAVVELKLTFSSGKTVRP